MTKTVKAVAKRTKKVVLPVKAFVAGQLAMQDTWDDGRGNSTTTTRLVRIHKCPGANQMKQTDRPAAAIVVLADGSLAIVGVKTLRHLPEEFNGATI